MRYLTVFLALVVVSFCAVLHASPALAEKILVYTALEDDQIPRYLESLRSSIPTSP